MAAAGVTGAIVALAGAWGLQTSRGPDPAIAALSQQIKTNETAIAALNKSAGPGLQAMEKRIAALESAVKQQRSAESALKADIEKLQQAAAAKPADVAKPADAAKPADSAKTAETASAAPAAADIAKLETRIAALETLASAAKSERRATSDPDVRPQPADGSAKAADQKNAAQQTSDQKAGDQKAGEAKQPAAATADRTAPPAVPATVIPANIAKLPPEVAKLAARLASLEKKIKPPADLGPVNAKIAAIASKLEPLEKQVDNKVESRIAPLAAAVAKSATTIAGNAKAIEAADAKAASSIARSNAAATTIVARTLQERVAAGKPFGGLVDAMTAMGTKQDYLDILKPLAATGVATGQQLTASFRDLKDKILAPEAPKKDTPIIDRLKQRAFSLVKVRPVGKSASTTPAGLVANIEVSLKDGAFAEAMKLFRQLPDKGRAAASAWAKQLQARIDADNAARSILSDSLTLLQQQKS